MEDQWVDGAVASFLRLDGLGDLAVALFEAFDGGDGGLMRALAALDA